MREGALLSQHRICQVMVLLLAVGLGVAVPARAQVTSGVITGTITDPQGGVLPGVTLTLRNVDTGFTRTTVSGTDGSYRMAGLPPGRYDLKADLQGFASAEVKALTLTIGLEIRRNLTMVLAGLEETVTVTGAAPVVETASSGVAAVVTQQQIETLPVPSRQAQALALLLPGTGSDAVRPRRTNVNVGAGGMTYFSSTYLVDGTDNMAFKAGEPRQDYPQAAIREFKVHVTQAPAEYGGRTGGVVTVVTKGGTNVFSGEVLEFFRDKSLNALNKFEKQLHDEQGVPKPAFRRHQFGGAFGGPIVKDRLHFFTAAERTTTAKYFTVSTGAPQFYSAVEGVFPADYLENLVFGRVDWEINPQQTLFVRYGYMDETTGCEDCGGATSAFSGSTIYNRRHSLVAGHTWVMSSRALNEIHFQYGYTTYYAYPPGTTPWKTVGEFPPERFDECSQVYNFPSLKWGSNSNSVVLSAFYEFHDDFSYTFDWHGGHTMKAGGAILFLPQWEDTPGDPKGTWTFATDQPFDPTDPASLANLKNPIQYTASFPPLYREIPNHRYQSAYVQDEWKPRSNLTLNLGVRYDLQSNGFNQGLDLSLYPKPLPFVDPSKRGDANNVGPRLGFAWDLKNDGTTVIRGAYGIFYQWVLLTSVVTEITTLRQVNVIIRNPAYPDPYQGQDPVKFASTAPPNIATLDNNIRNAKARTINLGFSRELRPNLAIHVDGVDTNSDGFCVGVNINTPDPVTGQRPLPEWGRIVQTQAIGNGKYRALMVRLEKRFADRYQYLVSYTLAKQNNSLATAYSATSPMTDFYNPGLDWGPADADRRHSIVASGSVLLPYDIALGAVWSLRSTMPFPAFAGTDLNHDGSVTDYVPGTTKNMGNRDNARMLELVNAWRATNGKGPVSADQIESNRYNSLDVRVSKTFPLGGSRKVELIAQVFNLLGIDNLLTPSSEWVTNALSDSFGRIPTANPRQQGELAVRFVW